MTSIPHRLRFLFLLGILLVAVTTVIPAVYVFFLSLVDQSGGVSLQSYGHVLTDHRAAEAMMNTLLFASAGTLVQVALGFALAKALTEIPSNAHVAFLLLLLAPWLVSEMASVIIWRLIFAGDVGPLDQITTWMGVGPLRLLAGTHTVKAGLIIVSVWRGLAFSTLFLFAALVAIPSSLYRVAAIEDLGYWRTLSMLEIPFLKRAFLSVGLVIILHNVNQFTLSARLTGGGPRYASTMLANYLFDELVTARNLSVSAAGGALTMALFGTIWLLARIITCRLGSSRS